MNNNSPLNLYLFEIDGCHRHLRDNNGLSPVDGQGLYEAEEVDAALSAKDAENNRIRHVLEQLLIDCNGKIIADHWNRAMSALEMNNAPPAPHPDTARAERREWQPIETASKDRYIAAWCPARRMSFQVIYREDPSGWCVIGDRYPFPEQFTHWQPMPEFDEAHQEPKP